MGRAKALDRLGSRRGPGRTRALRQRRVVCQPCTTRARLAVHGTVPSPWRRHDMCARVPWHRRRCARSSTWGRSAGRPRWRHRRHRRHRRHVTRQSAGHAAARRDDAHRGSRRGAAPPSLAHQGLAPDSIRLSDSRRQEPLTPATGPAPTRSRLTVTGRSLDGHVVTGRSDRQPRGEILKSPAPTGVRANSAFGPTRSVRSRTRFLAPLPRSRPGFTASVCVSAVAPSVAASASAGGRLAPQWVPGVCVLATGARSTVAFRAATFRTCVPVRTRRNSASAGAAQQVRVRWRVWRAVRP